VNGGVKIHAGGAGGLVRRKREPGGRWQTTDLDGNSGHEVRRKKAEGRSEGKVETGFYFPFAFFLLNSSF
jgi:hypothetical protein